MATWLCRSNRETERPKAAHLGKNRWAANMVTHLSQLPTISKASEHVG